MTTHNVMQAISESDGRLCARITQRPDGSIVTADVKPTGGLASRAAGVLAGAALSVGTIAAQSPVEQTGEAIVTGIIHNPDGKRLTALPEVLFVQDGMLIQQVMANADGSWKAEVSPGMYDVVFRTGQLFGERVKAVEVHAGEQSFSPVTERLNYGHLGLEDNSTETFTTMGQVVVLSRYPVRYLFRHPILYIRSLRRNFG